MSQFKAKTIGIVTITFVSFIQVCILFFTLSYLNPLIFERIIFLIDLTFPIIFLLSIWRAQKVGDLIFQTQLLKWYRTNFIETTTVTISTITILGSAIAVLIFMIVSYFNGFPIDYLMSRKNLMTFFFLFLIGVLDLHQSFSKRFGAPLTYYILKRFRK